MFVLTSDLTGLPPIAACSFCACACVCSEILCNKNKTVLSKGDTLKFTKLADTLETVAEKGVDEFYSGKIGQALIQDIKAAGWCNVGAYKLGLCV